MTDLERRDELIKGAIHLAAFALVSMCFGHNLKEFCKQPSANHGINVAVYGGALWFEARNVLGHWSEA